MHSTPWGTPQTKREIIPGVWTVSTAGHGGYYLDSARVAAFLAALPTFTPYAGLPWFEEDEDVSAPILVFAAEMPARSVWYAYRAVMARTDGGKWTATGGMWADVAAWLTSTEAGRAATAIALAFGATIADRWRPGSMFTTRKGWHVGMHHVSTGAYRSVRMGEYPTQDFYTTAELDAFGAA